jgi:hypothetical protein
VRRYDGDLSQAVSVQYRTKDGTAVAGLDFEGAAVSQSQGVNMQISPVVS